MGQGAIECYTEFMKNKRKFRRYFIFLPLSLLFLASTAYIFLKLPPDYKFAIANLRISILPFFFASLFALVFSLFTFVFRSRLQGLIFSSLIIFYMFLRFVELTSLLFLGLIIALFITIELFIYKKR